VVTGLSPYISRGVISTRQVFEHLVSLELPWSATEKLVQELAWRDYWQQVWLAKGELIFNDLKNTQSPIDNHQIPEAVISATTGIHAVDKAINELYRTGYMHNHMRMYVASIACNLAHSHWLNPARWLYYHLLDGDLASNHLSWQWVAGANASKKYYANQDNINKYFNANQKDTFLDVEYGQFDNLAPVPELLKTKAFELRTSLPEAALPTLEKQKTTLIYNYYNLDPEWHKAKDVQRVLLLEPSHFEKYPIGENSLQFMLGLAKNIPGILLFVGEFAALAEQVNNELIIYKEHPTNQHYLGAREERQWLTSVTGYFPSFFKFWNKAKKELRS
jgi:deoxyribodipyrimidine photo-lyase